MAARAARLRKDIPTFFKYALKIVACDGCAEICCELGYYYMEAGDLDEAIVWFYNAAYETGSILNIHSSGDIPLHALSKCYGRLGNREQEREYKIKAAAWKAEA